ncbi:MAG TPA: hypothetical protein VFT72_06665 [Opitutaceae bacterium]|nr:hypothetical protein [Opitutaceae bacterium]
MTYLRLEVCQSTKGARAEAVGVADFMIDEYDPRECVRRALLALRKHGWQALVLVNAEHGVSADDFKWGRRFHELFHEAKSSGLAFSVSDPVVAEAPIGQPAFA